MCGLGCNVDDVTGSESDANPMPRYVGQSWFVHWWPWFMVVFGLVQYLTDERFAGYAILFALCGIVFAWLLPWRFVVVDDGIGLWFTFGRRRFLPKSEVVVRGRSRVPGGVQG